MAFKIFKNAGTVKYLYNMVSRHAHFQSPLLKNEAYINGKWVAAKSGKTFQVTNPSTGDIIGDVADCNSEDVQLAIDAATEAFKTWGSTTAKERAKLLRAFFDLQNKYQDDLAKIITLEMGKTLKESQGEISYGSSFWEWFAEEARRIYGEVVQSPFPGRRMIFIRQPVGVAGLITPWNFPNAMITRKAGAALAAGCTCVIKPSEDTPYSALALAKIAEEAGFPPGVFNVLPTSRTNTPAVGKLLCESPSVAAISFTGSTAVGKLLLEQSASTVKKVSLELGGNAAFIVFNSADLDKAVAGAIASKFRCTGQTCVCTNRILVQEDIHDEFVTKLAAAMLKELKVGDGFDENASVGPLVNDKAVKKVEQHIIDAKARGGNVVVGGLSHSLGPNFFEPTLITNVTTDMLVCKEETFGPLAAVLKFKTEDEALQIANSVRTGLAGYFFTSDIGQAWRIAEKLQVGMVGVNEGLLTCAEGAFGGVKESGLGREGSKFGIDEFSNIKYICFGNLQF